MSILIYICLLYRLKIQIKSQNIIVMKSIIVCFENHYIEEKYVKKRSFQDNEELTFLEFQFQHMKENIVY